MLMCVCKNRISDSANVKKIYISQHVLSDVSASLARVHYYSLAAARPQGAGEPTRARSGINVWLADRNGPLHSGT